MQRPRAANRPAGVRGEQPLRGQTRHRRVVRQGAAWASPSSPGRRRRAGARWPQGRHPRRRHHRSLHPQDVRHERAARHGPRQPAAARDLHPRHQGDVQQPAAARTRPTRFVARPRDRRRHPPVLERDQLGPARLPAGRYAPGTAGRRHGLACGRALLRPRTGRRMRPAPARHGQRALQHLECAARSPSF